MPREGFPRRTVFFKEAKHSNTMSALRINLLPAYIAEARRTKAAITAFSALFVLGLVGSLYAYKVKDDETRAMEEAAAQKTTEATTATGIVNAIKSESSGLRAQIAPIGDRVTFVKAVRFYNTWVQKIYRRAAAYTDKRVEYSSMAVTDGSLAMSGYVTRTPDGSPVDNLSRYLITFYGNPDVTAVTVSGPPGWQRPAASTAAVDPLASQNTAARTAARGFSFSVNATLLKALQRPVLPATLTAAPAVTEAGPDGAAATPAGAPGTAPPPGMPAGRGTAED